MPDMKKVMKRIRNGVLTGLTAGIIGLNIGMPSILNKATNTDDVINKIRYTIIRNINSEVHRGVEKSVDGRHLLIDIRSLFGWHNRISRF